MTDKSKQLVKTAVFPVAGLGTRFLPATKASPKEMMPIVDKPLIQYAVEEAYAAGIRNMVFVTGRNKRAIEDHFDTAYELESELERAGKSALLQIARNVVPEDMNCLFVRQPRMMGLGHAVLCAAPLVGHFPFAVLLADDLMIAGQSGKSVLAQMVEQYNVYHSSILAVQEIPPEHSKRYGVVAGNPLEERLVKIGTIVEKPEPAKAPSNLGVVGRYILNPAIFDHLRSQSAGVGGEIQLTDAIAHLLKDELVLAYKFDGKRYDCGAKDGFLEATVEIALQHPEVGEIFRRYLDQHVCKKPAAKS
ncbi:UTP--glucose-1-phosphate uridylyltransferase GalU [Saezia sanguinis]|uniref:UTP--glucose-1-phosphate uridylyltransferase GalU n=1 Tax=Saezia sanguinis TaxID=1965230 RepID=UPI003037C3A4